jgi:hydroxypyruvate reductase
MAASHPVPDHRSLQAAVKALELARELRSDDLLLFLVSGGGSSLMCLPADGLSLREKRELNRQLLASGASISQINCIRKHLSKVKGGRLAMACQARVVTLAVSDVPGSDPSLIASGPTLEDPTSLADAKAILEELAIVPGPGVKKALQDQASETPAFDKRRQADRFHVVASGRLALEAAARRCHQQNIEAQVLGDHLEGEASVLAREHAGMALDLAASGKSVCLLSGGETTVRLPSPSGRGGRNTEYALAMAIELEGYAKIWALAADTDGIDGIGGHSGAVIGPATLSRGHANGLDPKAFLQSHDSASYFEATGGLISVGPTHTNVNDFRALLINPE